MTLELKNDVLINDLQYIYKHKQFKINKYRTAVSIFWSGAVQPSIADMVNAGGLM